jgi:hypothetical protein
MEEDVVERNSAAEAEAERMPTDDPERMQALQQEQQME